MDSSSPPIASSSRVTLDNHSNDRQPLLSSSHSNHQHPIPRYRSIFISPASDPNPNPIPRRNMVSTMLGFTPKRVPESSVKEVAVIDPTASAYVDPQTGALIEEKSKAERWFVARLDAVLLVFVCISQVIKYLDQQKLNLYGNQYNYFTTYFNVGYAIFLIPSQIIITRVRPSLWLPALEACWGILTIATYKVTNYKQVYAIRAFTGAFEASCYPGAIMLLMSWYTPRELALRIGFYHSCQSIGSMLAGALQAAIYNSMDGRNGISGWRWMFIIDGIVTLVVSFAGLVLIPDFPSKPNPWSFYLRPSHIDLARSRAAKFRRADNKKFTFSSVKKAVTGPLFYCFVILYVASVLGQGGYNYFNLWLKSLTNPDGTRRWSVAQINAIPIGGSAIAVAMIWIWGFISDYFQTRWIPIVIQAGIGLIPGIIMSIWNVSDNAKYFSYFACFLSLATAPPIFAWLSDLNPFDAEQRAFTLGFAIAFYYACGAWSGPLIWPASEAPHYHHGWQVTIAMWCLVIIMACSLRVVELKFIRPQNVRKAAEDEHEERIRQEEEDEEDKKHTEVGRVISVVSHA
ncbi:hypothetical protein I305_06745 [Cryptococcus gattii E566]|uniref:Major facilitator superfamily (MFS) profile domain-containing protein n=2 Tax=Cryptococcus gattii TaxID=37769 RepID=E6RE17_CRYGW|nr:uncharacterized protein CGB_K4450C [Cryptococcus gattii WM276]ADV25066.1 Conserved hypothetical protein [Cryptococcus gattii WM276]KIR79004.1 hypothetical protein I306_03981 [Cryptococcus gattii EJB2]KIY30861.1 hypothetical protein I305_06745 [Cryptococcus gattii E566]KJE01742.1 hypothetical protein I311_04656 [Cryptococcus gattii NT-10]